MVILGNLYLPKIIFEGETALEEFIDHLHEQGYKKLFIVTDKNLVNIGLFNKLTESLEGFDFTYYDEIEAEPSIDSVESLSSHVIEYEPQVIIALGGGSIIDAAKGAWIKYENPSFNLEEISPFEKIGVGRKSILASIPTTSGTGSEATLGVVYSVWKGGKKEKIALGSYELISHIVVLDPRFVIDLPKKLTIYTALDTLSHATEAYVSSTSNDFTDGLSYKVILNVFEFLPRLVSELDNVNLRRRIHMTATMGGMAFSNSGLGLAHGIAHVVGPAFGLHHGRTVAIVLPYIVKFNYSNEKASKKYNIVRDELNRRDLADDEPFYLQLYNFIESLTGEVSFKDIINEDKYFKLIDDLSGLILQDPDVVYNPIIPSEDDVKKLLADIYLQELK